MNKDLIVKRLYVKGRLKLIAPMSLSSGEEDNTDKDVLRSWSDIPFISASTQAGAMRSFLRRVFQEQNGAIANNVLDLLFGKPEGGKNDPSRQSLVYFYDAHADARPTVETRDGVKLDYRTKTAIKESKYDYETLPAGQSFRFELEVVFRERHREHIADCLKLMRTLLEAMQEGKIALGAKKKRGFGQIILEEPQYMLLNMDQETSPDIDRWIHFSWDSEEGWHSDWDKLSPRIDYHECTVNIIAKFKAPFSLLIRSASTDPGAPDVSHLTSGGLPVIPGSSWTGALRHAIYHIGLELGMSRGNVENIIEEMFGYTRKESARASEIAVGETVIANSRPLANTRNKIDRFTAGTVETALFDAQAEYSDAPLKLQITIEPAFEQRKVAEWKIALILFALRDMSLGIQPIGGETSIGRGILEGIEITVDDQEVDWERYGKALAKNIAELERKSHG